MECGFFKKLNSFNGKSARKLLSVLVTIALIMSVCCACGDDDDPVQSMLNDRTSDGSSYNTATEPSGDEMTTTDDSGSSHIGGNTEENTSSDSSAGSTADTSGDESSGDESSNNEGSENSSSDNKSTVTTEPPTTTAPPATTKPTTTAPTTTTAPPTTTTKPPATTTQETTTAAPAVNYNVNIQMPVASGTSVSDMNGYVIDYSNMKDGYVMVKSTTSATAVVQIYLDSKSGTLIGQYFIDETNTYLAFPLTKGANTYCVRVLEQKSSGGYVQKNVITEYAAISPETKAYIHPNMYVDFNANSSAVRLSCELCAGKTTDEAKVKAIYEYIINNIDYDYDFAKQVAANGTVGYMDAERCLKNKKGICGDYSVLFATMCRAQGIPCMVVEGYVTTTEQIFHAWNKVYLNGAWKFYDTTFDAGGGTGKSYIEVYFY